LAGPGVSWKQYRQFRPRTLQTWDTAGHGHFGTSAELPVRNFGTGAEVSGHFGTSL